MGIGDLEIDRLAHLPTCRLAHLRAVGRGERALVVEGEGVGDGMVDEGKVGAGAEGSVNAVVSDGARLGL